MRFIIIPLMFVFYGCFPFKKEVSDITEKNIKNKTLQNGWYHISKQKNNFKRVNEKGEVYYINPNAILTPKHFLKSEEFDNHQGDTAIAVYFNRFGTIEWEKATDRATNSNLVFILNNKIFSSLYVNGKITGGVCAFWKKSHSEKKWKELKKITNPL